MSHQNHPIWWELFGTSNFLFGQVNLPRFTGPGKDLAKDLAKMVAMQLPCRQLIGQLGWFFCQGGFCQGGFLLKILTCANRFSVLFFFTKIFLLKFNLRDPRKFRFLHKIDFLLKILTCANRFSVKIGTCANRFSVLFFSLEFFY